MRNSDVELKIKIRKNSKKRWRKCVAVFLAIFISAYVCFATVAIPVLYSAFEAELGEMAASLVNEQAFRFVGLTGDKNVYFDCTVNSDGYVTSVVTDSRCINALSRRIASSVQTGIDNVKERTVEIPFGNFTKIHSLYGRGKILVFKMRPTGSASCEVYSELSACGINQTRYKLYVTVSAELVVVMPRRTLREKYSSDYLVFENLIAGKVPDSYLNISGGSGRLELNP